MIDVIFKVLPFVFIVVVGYLLKASGLLSSKSGSSLLKVVFYVGLPAIIFLSITDVEIDLSLLSLAFFAPSVIVITLLVGYLLRASFLKKINIKTFGTLIIGSSIMNLGFILPFVEKIYGSEGLARLVIIDTFNILTVFSLLYVVAVKFGNDLPDKSLIIKKILQSPPFWALALGLVFKISNITTPDIFINALDPLANIVGPVILLALGLKFTFKMKKPKLLFFPLILRFGLGAIIGFCFIKIFQLQGLNAQIVTLASIAPVGINSITFSDLEKLDSDFAASQVSIGILIGLVLIPLAISQI